ncbi:MAG: hypothetical protein ACQETI_07950, partial [Halobacteriota archaeon]
MSQGGWRADFSLDRRKFVRSLGVAGVVGLTGCTDSADRPGDGGSGSTDGGEASDTPTSASTATPTPTDRDEVKMGGELVATLGGEVKNYDPTQISDSTSSKAFGLIYESLLGVD